MSPSSCCVEICISFPSFRVAFSRWDLQKQIVPDDCDNLVTTAANQKMVSIKLVEIETESCASLGIGNVILESALPCSIN